MPIDSEAVKLFTQRLSAARVDRAEKCARLSSVVGQMAAQMTYLDSAIDELLKQLSEPSRYLPTTLTVCTWAIARANSLIGPRSVRWFSAAQRKRKRLKRMTAANLQQRSLPAFQPFQLAALERLQAHLTHRLVCRDALRRLLRACPPSKLGLSALEISRSQYLEALSAHLLTVSDRLDQIETELDVLMQSFNWLTKRAQGGLMVRWQLDPLHPQLPHGPKGPFFFLFIRGAAGARLSRRVAAKRTGLNPITKQYLLRIAYHQKLNEVLAAASHLWAVRSHRLEAASVLLALTKAIKPYYQLSNEP